MKEIGAFALPIWVWCVDVFLSGGGYASVFQGTGVHTCVHLFLCVCVCVCVCVCEVGSVSVRERVWFWVFTDL